MSDVRNSLSAVKTEFPLVGIITVTTIAVIVMPVAWIATDSIGLAALGGITVVLGFWLSLMDARFIRKLIHSRSGRRD